MNDNRLPLYSINIGCAAANLTVDLKRRDEIANEDISKFCKKCRKMLIVLIEKLLERMTVSLPFLRSLQCVIATNISDKEKKSGCTKQFQHLAHYLPSNSIITTTVGDKAFREYRVLISTGKEIGKCSKFDRKKRTHG